MAQFSRLPPFWGFESWPNCAYMDLNNIDGGNVFEAVIFATIAAFLGFRLYAVLGKRTGHEQSIGKPAEDVVGLPKKPEIIEDSRETQTMPRAVDVPPLDESAAIGVRAISAAESNFHPGEFVEGAKSAYRMILESFWRGDEDALSDLVSTDVREAFAEAIADRKAAGQVLDNRLVSIERAVISEASLTGKTARITMRFDADIAAVTRDADGKVVAGSTSDAVSTHDVWTFERTVKSANPNWILVDTDEAS
jgi:predicted lipid-binding transport protein (Tim44 family)